MSTATVMLLPFDAGDRRRVSDSGDVSEFAVRQGNGRPAHAVYVRRRLLVGLVVIGLLTVFGVTAQSVLADRGGVPASTPTVRLVTADLAAASSPPCYCPPGTRPNLFTAPEGKANHNEKAASRSAGRG